MRRQPVRSGSVFSCGCSSWVRGNCVHCGMGRLCGTSRQTRPGLRLSDDSYLRRAAGTLPKAGQTCLICHDKSTNTVAPAETGSGGETQDMTIMMPASDQAV